MPCISTAWRTPWATPATMWMSSIASTSYHLQHPAEPEIQFAEHPNVQRHGLHSRYGWLSPLLTQQTGRPYLKQKEIQQVLNSKPYDVIHYHNISLLGPEILRLQPPEGRAVKLYTTHEHWLICPMHVLWKFNSQGLREAGLPGLHAARQAPAAALALYRDVGARQPCSRPVRFAQPLYLRDARPTRLSAAGGAPAILY